MARVPQKRTPLSHTSYSWGEGVIVCSAKKPPPGHTFYSWGIGAQEQLRRLGYRYDGRDEFGGKLRRISPYGGARGDGGFVWNGQEHYDLLAEAVLQYAESTLVSVGRLVKFELLRGCNVYHSEDFFTNTENLLVLIQGTGRVRVGVWGCALCINDSMKNGSMVEYVLRAQQKGYAVLVLNPNCQSEEPGSRSKEEHCLTAWDRLVDSPADRGDENEGSRVGRSPARRICVVGHSYGGVCSVELLKRRQRSFQARVAALALTDSAHSVGGSLAPLGTPKSRAPSLTSRFTALFTGGKSEGGAGAFDDDDDDDEGGVEDPFQALGGEAGSPERRQRISAAAKKLASARAFLASEKAVNWVAAGQKADPPESVPPLDSPVAGPAQSGTGTRHLSAGTFDHASTNFAAVDSVFAFFDARLSTPPRPYGPTAWS
jgi:hypothetical protein